MTTDLSTLKPGAVQPLPADDAREAAFHHWSQAEINALRLAHAAERPLLVRGEPGTGKTQLARAVAQHLGWCLQAVTVHPRIDAQDLVYRFDAIRRLADAQANRPLDEASYIEPGPLWRAYEWTSAIQHGSLRTAPSQPQPPAAPSLPAGHVVLIDEIDKADSDLPNSLLEVLGQRSLFVAPLNRHIGGPKASRPLVVITTNEERELPSAFVRRCMVLNLVPDSSLSYAQWLVQRGQAHYATGALRSNDKRPRMALDVLEQAATQLCQDRDHAQRTGVHAPGPAEYLDLLRALHQLAPGNTTQQQHWLQELSAYAFVKNATLQPADGDALPTQARAFSGHALTAPAADQADPAAPTP
jgi:MoxR-like ATPase